MQPTPLRARSTFPLLLAMACSSDPSPGTGALPASAGSAGAGQGGAGTGGSSGSGGGAAGQLGAGAGAGGASSGSGGASAGGASGSAGSAGASGGSAGASGGSGGGLSGCQGVSAKFCDDFEAQAEGQPPTGAFDVSGDGIVVDTSKAVSGTKAVHITSAAPTSTQWLEFSEQFPMNDYHGRAMFFLQQVPQADFHWDILQSNANGDVYDSVYWEIGGMYGDFILVVDPPDHGLGSNPFPEATWFCLQWQFKYGGGGGMPNTFAAKMDGSALMDGEFTGPDVEGESWDAGPWQNLQIGWTAYGSSDVDLELWIDDLAFGEQEIPCPAVP